jgi:hypothetical protein
MIKRKKRKKGKKRDHKKINPHKCHFSSFFSSFFAFVSSFFFHFVILLSNQGQALSAEKTKEERKQSREKKEKAIQWWSGDFPRSKRELKDNKDVAFRMFAIELLASNRGDLDQKNTLKMCLFAALHVGSSNVRVFVLQQ